MLPTVPEATARLLEQRLSRERLGPYRDAVGNDLDQALALYEWNARMGAVFWVTLGHVEVLVRNAMHQRLTEWSAEAHGEPLWYVDPGGVLTEQTRAEIAKARYRAGRSRRETPGRVVAELSLGFWRYLLISSYDRSLWIPCLRHVWEKRGLRRDVHEALGKLHDLRNRIAHHEPIYNRPLKELHGTALTLAEWTCPVMAAWIESRCEVLPVLATRPWTVRASASGPARKSGPRQGPV